MKKSSVVLVVLILAILVLMGCAKESESTISTKKNEFAGVWFSEDARALWIFDDNGSARTFSSVSGRIAEQKCSYSANGNELCFEICDESLGGGKIREVWNFTFQGKDRLTLTYTGYALTHEFTRIKDGNKKEYPIVGTWVSISGSFDLHLGSSSYRVGKLSFYKDGTYRTTSESGDNFGEYTFLFDGEVLQMRSGWSSGELDYELFGEDFMLIKVSIYNGEMYSSHLLKKVS